MSTTPRRPGPVAYISLGVLTTISFAPLVIRVVTAAMDVSLGRAWNLTLFGTLTVLMAGAGAHTAYLIIRYFRACRAEDEAVREAREAELRAELAELAERVKDVEDKAWWNDPESVLPEDDTVDLSNVRMLPVRNPPEKRSS